jgi:hypothetical protein
VEGGANCGGGGREYHVIFEVVNRRTVLVQGIELVLVGGLVGARDAWAEQFVLIRNAKNHSQSVQRTLLKDMCIGRRKAWPGGEVVQMVLGPNGSPELTWLAERVIGVPEHALREKIKQEIFKGEMRRPIVVSTDGDCLTAVARYPGAVGVVHVDTARSLAADCGLLAVT